uniref:Uncharacterized protein n=1 Tax=Kryptolebias marmoratus TaxID=37003 RepID=A0A3Q3A7S6_KRYMA
MSVKLGGNIVVTGTNRGVGLELVRQLAEKTGEDAHIYVCCREPESPRAEVKHHHVHLDSISAAVQAVSQQIGSDGLNLLINNAAINKPLQPATLLDTIKSNMMEVFETNVAGPFLLSKVGLSYVHFFLCTSTGNAFSRSGKMSCPKWRSLSILGSCSRMREKWSGRSTGRLAALNMLTRCQAEDFKSHNILVMAIHPGLVRTDMGGEMAPLTPEDSVVGMLGVMSTLSRKHTGTLLDWEGNTIPW